MVRAISATSSSGMQRRKLTERSYCKLHDDLLDKSEMCCPKRVAHLSRLAGINAQIGYKRRPDRFGGNRDEAEHLIRVYMEPAGHDELAKALQDDWHFEVNRNSTSPRESSDPFPGSRPRLTPPSLEERPKKLLDSITPKRIAVGAGVGAGVIGAGNEIRRALRPPSEQEAVKEPSPPANKLNASAAPQSIVIERGGKWYVVPTVISGQAYDPATIESLFASGLLNLPEVGEYETQEEAEMMQNPPRAPSLSPSRRPLPGPYIDGYRSSGQVN